MNGSLEGCLLCLTAATQTGEEGMQHHWLSRSPRGHSDDAMNQPDPKEIMQQDLTTDWRLCKVRQTNALLSFFFFFTLLMFLVRRFMWGYAATHDDCGSLKGNHEKSGKCPCGFLKTHSKASGTACSLRSPLAAAVASCPSIREGKGWGWWGQQQIYGEFDIEHSPEMFGWHTDNAGHLLNCDREVTRSCSQSSIMYW